MLQNYLAQAPATINNIGTVATIKGLEGIFQNTLQIVFYVVGIALFIMILVGGFQFMTAGGDPKKVSSAWNTLTYAVVGVLLTTISYLIIRYIGYFTGVRRLFDFMITR